MKLTQLSLNLQILLAAILVLGLTSTVLCQEAARSERGTPLNRNYSISDIENINLQNGNLNLSIPLASLPPIAGGKLGSTVNVRYDSKLWDVLRGGSGGESRQRSSYRQSTTKRSGRCRGKRHG